MARRGVASRPKGTTPAALATRQALVDAAIETLKSKGFVGASARAIAGRAGCNQALVFYHFGSVIELLLAALDTVSARRMQRYREAASRISGPEELAALATEVFREDMDSGDVTVLAEMIAGAAATPGLGAEVVRRIAPWRDFARDAIAAGLAPAPFGALVPAEELAYAAVAFYLGVEMLSHLDGDRSRALSLFDHVGRLAAMLDALAGMRPSPTKEA